MKPIRWKRRLHGRWVGFVGTSRKPTCEIKRSGGKWRARANWHDWLAAPTWRQAAEWCEAQLAPPPPRRLTPVAIVVDAEGKAERRAMERFNPVLAVLSIPRMPLVMPLAEAMEQVTATRTVYEGREWAMSYENPMAGVGGTFRVIVYAHPAADPERVRRAALGELKERRMMLDRLIYETDGRYGAGRELQRIAERIFEGEALI